MRKENAFSFHHRSCFRRWVLYRSVLKTLLWSRASSPNGSSETSLELRSLKSEMNCEQDCREALKNLTQHVRKSLPSGAFLGPSRNCAQDQKKNFNNDEYENDNAKARKEFLLTFKFWRSCDEVQKVLNYPRSSKWGNKTFLEIHLKEDFTLHSSIPIKSFCSSGFCSNMMKILSSFEGMKCFAELFWSSEIRAFMLFHLPALSTLENKKCRKLIILIKMDFEGFLGNCASNIVEWNYKLDPRIFVFRLSCHYRFRRNSIR